MLMFIEKDDNDDLNTGNDNDELNRCKKLTSKSSNVFIPNFLCCLYMEVKM